MKSEIEKILNDKNFNKILLNIHRYCIENDIIMSDLIKKWIIDSFNIEKYGKRPFDRENNDKIYNKIIVTETVKEEKKEVIENKKEEVPIVKETKKKVRILNK